VLPILHTQHVFVFLTQTRYFILNLVRPDLKNKDLFFSWTDDPLLEMYYCTWLMVKLH